MSRLAPRLRSLSAPSLLLVLAAAAVALAQARVEVKGSDVTFPAEQTRKLAGKEVTLRITGTALREKAWFNVYAIASYLDQNAKDVKTPQQLAEADVPKVLALVMERDVDGEDMAEAFRDAILLNYSASKFTKELKTFEGFFRTREAEEGNRIVFTHLPGEGVACEIVGKGALKIESVPFSRAIWELYLGPKNIGEEFKKGLTSRL